MKFHLIKLCFLCVLLVSCNTSKEIVYFQDIVVNQPEAIIGARDITVQPKDQISIMVSSKDPQLAALFNLTRVQYRAGSTDLRTGSNSGEISGYTLDDKGDIDFPVIGTLHIAGMTKSQIAALVKKRLMEENLVNDPVVTVEFMNASDYRYRDEHRNATWPVPSMSTSHLRYDHRSRHSNQTLCRKNGLSSLKYTSDPYIL